MGIPFLDHVFDPADPFGSAVPLLPFLFPGREPADDGNLRIQPLAQGTTNGLFKVTNRSADAATADAVLVKVYGDGTDITIDRHKELRVHRLLADHGLSSSPLVRFANGHAYQFIHGSVCSEADMSKTEISRGVARELARWHATLSLIKLRNAQEVLNHEPGVWVTAKKWLDEVSKHPGRSKAEIAALHEKFQYLANHLLPTDKTPEPLVLGHGDLLCANIIVQTSADDIGATDVASVRFIDYEHATYCPRAFELANHFAEWTGFECDYNLLPNTSTRRAFVREYLEARADLAREPTHLPGTKDLLSVSDYDVEKLMRQVDDYRGFPGFYWGLCALIQAETATGTIDFDYAGYAQMRFEEYDAWREVHDGSVDSVDMTLREKNWARP
ncbi:ethanolamine kinase [Fusarium heterosporum]|uniref:ethanolamine kinase n=1 Tax=Fusarium heterosporum TaxID=42747 RepID=A0A8H5WRN5_FUSHE|nr:ethanolamine kinase [Fusarium heterosporum]